jgi:hypothetical protein
MKLKTTLLLAMAMVLVAGCGDDYNDGNGKSGEQSTVQGRNNRALTLNPIDDVVIERGGTAKVDITIERRNVEGEISVDFDELPGGVSVANEDTNIVGNEGTYHLQAADDADLVEGHRVEVTITGPEDIGVTKQFEIHVTAPE